jgi:predicted esterase
MNLFPALAMVAASAMAQGWQSDLDQLLISTSPQEQEELIEEIVMAAPPWAELANELESITFAEVETGRFLVRSTVCIDGVERPWVLYVPEGYTPEQRTPLLVVLHGGVSRQDLIENPLGYAEESAFSRLGKSEGWLMLFPFGQAEATWWDETGIANIRNLIRIVKRQYNVDDDRVWMCGFSDGASAAFEFAMIHPNDFGAFVALNGHIGVANLDGDIPTYAPNLYNTPLYATTTDQDALYPSEVMRPTIEMARRAGGLVFYREHEGEHEFSYAEDELPRIARFLNRHPRDPFPTRIVWEAAVKEYGLCRWLAIDEITASETAGWHTDYNTALVDDRIVIGFVPDETFEGNGVKVGRVVDEETLAKRINLQPDDIIVGANGQTIDNIDELSAFKYTLERGDEVTLQVQRADQKLSLTGTLPEPQNYFIFGRDMPSAMVRASFYGNKVEVSSSRLGALRVLVHPDMVKLDQNLLIAVDGRVVYNSRVEPDIEFMLRNFLANRDRRLVYVSEIELGL